MFAEDPTLSTCNLAFEIRIRHMIVWRFLRRRLRLLLYKLKIHQQIHDETNVEKIDFAQYCYKKLWDDFKFLNQLFFRKA